MRRRMPEAPACCCNWCSAASRAEWAARQRQLGFADFMRLKGFQPFGLVHPLGFVREQHRVAVKRNPQLVG